MAKAREKGFLVLADISGYTKFLTGTELEHADAILEELVRGLLASVQKPLRLVKLEGDAIFAYALEGDTPDGRVVVDRLEDAYHAFRMQLFNIARSSTCTCSACKTAPSLDLKFMLHYGEFMIHDLAGHDDLQGPDVILVHRLLKNEVVEKTGTRAYLLATAAARSRLGALDWVDHAETYEHIGDVPCGFRDMHAVYASLTESGAVDVKPEQADFVATFDVPALPAVVWEWQIDGSKVVQWQGLDAWSISPNDDGRVRAGAMVHCAHGKSTQHMRILGWRPFRSWTTESPVRHGMMPPHRFTAELVPLEGGAGTRVSWRVMLTRQSLLDRFLGWIVGMGFGMFVKKAGAKLGQLVTEEKARAKPPLLERRPSASTAA